MDGDYYRYISREVETTKFNCDMKIVQEQKRKVDRWMVFIIFIFLEILRQLSLQVI